MNVIIVNEQQLQIDIEKLRGEFTETQDLYREVCVLLFFRYGITPTANKLYQYVRRGSMSAPADALNKFWSELREKSRVRIDRTDIPEKLNVSAGNFIAALWNEAQEAAQAGFSELIENATAEILKFKLEAEIAKQDVAKTHQELNETLYKLENDINLIAEAEKIHVADTSAMAAQEKSLKTLQNERDHLERLLEGSRADFSRDLEKLNISLIMAEERYQSLEAKSLLEVDRARQHASKLDKELNKLRETSRSDHVSHQKELSSIQNIVTEQREKIGMLNGQLSITITQYKDATKQIRLTERKLEVTTNKLMRLLFKPQKIIKATNEPNGG